MEVFLLNTIYTKHIPKTDTIILEDIQQNIMTTIKVLEIG